MTGPDSSGDPGTSGPASSGGVLLDPAAFVRLREWGGDELLHKMIDLFLENAPGRMAQIRAGMEGGDASEVEAGSHALKSSAGNLGAESLRRSAAALEAATEAEDARVDAVVDLFEDLEQRFEATEAALREARDRERS